MPQYPPAPRVPPVFGSAAPLSSALPPIHQRERGQGNTHATQSAPPATSSDAHALVVFDPNQASTAQQRAQLESRSTTVVARRGSAGPTMADLSGFRSRAELRERGGLVPKKSVTPQPQALAVGSRSTSPADPSPLRLLDATATPATRGGGNDLDLTMGSSSAKTSAQNRCLFGQRARRKVHPLQEERAQLDVWPAMAVNKQSSSGAVSPTPSGAVATTSEVSQVLSRPQILEDLFKYLTEELLALKHAYPDVSDAKVRLAPPTEAETRQADPDAEYEAALILAARSTTQGVKGSDAEKKAALQRLAAARRRQGSDSTARMTSNLGTPCSREDAFHMARVRLFGVAMEEFSKQFSAYRPLLAWIGTAFEDFAAYCHKHVWSPEARLEFQRDCRAQVEAELAEQKRQLQNQVLELQNHLAETKEALAKIEASQSTIRFQIDDRDRIIAQKDKEIAENTDGRAGLLNRITRLEKELWQQRLMLEEPEKRIQELMRINKDQDDRLVRMQIVFDEYMKEKTLLKDRIERLEEQIREQKKKMQGTGLNAAMKAEILSYKRRELELLELNAKLQARAERVEIRMAEMSEALHVSRGDGPMTPRPQWPEFADVCSSAAPNTMKKVQDMAGAFRQLLASKETLEREMGRLKSLLGSAYREDIALFGPRLSLQNNSALASIYVATDEVMPQMRAKWFCKLGIESHVPGYLKGVGKAENLFLGRDTISSVVRHLWMERQAVKPGTPWDLFMSKFLSERCPPGVRLDSFAYSVHHSMGWYAYDPFIGFTRNLILGGIDETVFLDLQQGVMLLRTELGQARQRGRSPDQNQQHAAQQQQLQLGSATPPPGTPATTTKLALTSDIPKTLIASTLIEVCGDKDDTAVKSLVVALSRDCPGRTVDLDLVFNFDAEHGRFSNFLEEYYRQYFESRRRLIAAIVDGLYEADTDDEGHLAAPTVAQVLLSVDPHMPAQYLDECVARLCGVTIEQLFPVVDKFSANVTVGLEGERVYGCQDTVNSDVTDIVAKLQQGVVRKFSPPESTSATGAQQRKSPSPVDSPTVAAEPEADADVDDAAFEAMLA